MEWFVFWKQAIGCCLVPKIVQYLFDVIGSVSTVALVMVWSKDFFDVLTNGVSSLDHPLLDAGEYFHGIV